MLLNSLPSEHKLTLFKYTQIRLPSFIITNEILSLVYPYMLVTIDFILI